MRLEPPATVPAWIAGRRPFTTRDWPRGPARVLENSRDFIECRSVIFDVVEHLIDDHRISEIVRQPGSREHTVTDVKATCLGTLHAFRVGLDADQVSVSALPHHIEHSTESTTNVNDQGIFGQVEHGGIVIDETIQNVAIVSIMPGIIRILDKFCHFVSGFTGYVLQCYRYRAVRGKPVNLP